MKRQCLFIKFYKNLQIFSNFPFSWFTTIQYLFENLAVLAHCLVFGNTTGTNLNPKYSTLLLAVYTVISLYCCQWIVPHPLLLLALYSEWVTLLLTIVCRYHCHLPMPILCAFYHHHHHPHNSTYTLLV